MSKPVIFLTDPQSIQYAYESDGNPGSKKAPVTDSSKANLIMPIARVMGMMRKDRLNERVSKDAGIRMTAILESLVE